MNKKDLSSNERKKKTSWAHEISSDLPSEDTVTNMINQANVQQGIKTSKPTTKNQ